MMYTFGVWTWASQPTTNVTPELEFAGQTHVQKIELDIEPRFYAFQMSVPVDVKRAWIKLQPNKRNGSNETIFYDGLVFSPGNYPVDQIPDLFPTNAHDGTWGGKSYENLLRNSSAEVGGLGIKPRIDR